MISQVELESTDIGEKKYYLVAPEGLIFHEIPFEEIHNLTREVWCQFVPIVVEFKDIIIQKMKPRKIVDSVLNAIVPNLF